MSSIDEDLHPPAELPRRRVNHAVGGGVGGGAAMRGLGLGLHIQGSAAWLWAPGGGEGPSALGLASALAEHEQRKERIEVVTVCVQRREDASWLRPVLAWLEAHGRGIVLRTRVRLPREFVLELRGRDLAIELELASLDPAVQRGLLGEGAAPATELLLQAQHFAALGLRVGVRVGPVMPGVHDLERVGALLAAARAADLHGVSLFVGELDAGALGRLHRVIDDGALMVLMRSFRLPPTAAFDLDFPRRRLPADLALALRSRFAALVEGLPGLQLEDLAAAQAIRHRGDHRSVLQPSLFEDQFAG